MWNAEKKWAIEQGEYTAWVGGSSQASLSTQIQHEAIRKEADE
jgi:beta-glucosidase